MWHIAMPGAGAIHPINGAQWLTVALTAEDRVYSGDGLQRDGGDVMGRLALPGIPLGHHAGAQGHDQKKLYSIYREEGLSVRRRRCRKRARGIRTPLPVPLQPNLRWSLDFLSDTFGACRENLTLIADTSISGARVARELEATEPSVAPDA